MSLCKHRIVDKCKKDGRPCIFSEKCFEPEEQKPMTNADHIRSMSDENLAMVIIFAQIKQIERIREQLNEAGIVLKANDCEGDLQRMISWLKQPYKGGEL